MQWLVEYTNLKETSTFQIKNSLLKIGAKPYFFGFNREDDELFIPYFNNNDPIILRPSIQAMIAIQKNKYKNPILDHINNYLGYNQERFDQYFIVKNNRELPFVNGQAMFVSYESLEDISEKLNFSVSEDSFIKSSSDLKFFPATKICRGENILDKITGMNFDLEKLTKGQSLLISSLKNIKSEYRFIFIGDDLVGKSSYIIEGNYNIEGIIPQRVIDAAKGFAKIYHPSKIYTLDVCELEDGAIEIVEYNCWNTSGLYNIDQINLFKAIEESYQDQ